MPLNRTTSGVPVSFAFFFPWSRYVSDHQFCGFKPQNPSSVAAKPAFFPISHPKNLRQNLSTFAFSSRAADHHICYQATVQGIKRLAHCHRLSQKCQRRSHKSKNTASYQNARNLSKTTRGLFQKTLLIFNLTSKAIHPKVES